MEVTCKQGSLQWFKSACQAQGRMSYFALWILNSWHSSVFHFFVCSKNFARNKQTNFHPNKDCYARMTYSLLVLFTRSQLQTKHDLHRWRSSREERNKQLLRMVLLKDSISYPSKSSKLIPSITLSKKQISRLTQNTTNPNIWKCIYNQLNKPITNFWWGEKS